MRSNKTRIRKDFAPLTVAVSIKCTTPAVPMTQIFNGGNLEYEPDRELSPTILLPEVVANASDGTWGAPEANHALANMKWFVNGKDIETLTDWSGKYSVDLTESSTRGAISVKRNVSPGEHIELHFEADIVDNRLGVTIPIVTDKVLLSTVENAEDGYSLSIDDSAVIQYDPVKDKLRLYDYKVAHGMIAASASAREEATDKCAYRHTIPFELFCGKTKLTSGYTMKFYRVDSARVLTQLTTASAEVEALTATSVTLDLRVIENATYVLKAFVGDKEVAMAQFGVGRIYQAFDISPTNGTAIHPLDTERIDRAMVDCDGNIVECPGNIIKIVWFTDSVTKTAVKHNEGETTIFSLDKTGIGNSYADSAIDVYCEAEYKPAHKVATNDGNILTDKNGNPYIFN